MIDPVLTDIPTQVETDRLWLRPPEAGDGAALFDAIVESLPDLRRYLASLPWVGGPQSIEASETWCRNAQANFIARKDLPFLMIEKTTGQIVGATGLHRVVWATPKAEIGYWVRASRSGRGYVGEAVRALTACAFEHLGAARVEIVTDQGNAASRRVAERCGFVLEGLLRDERRAADGSLRNTCIYACFPPPAAEPDATVTDTRS